MKRGCLDVRQPGRQTDVHLATDCRKLMSASAVARKLSLLQCEFLRDLYVAAACAVSILYEPPDDNGRMAIHSNRTRTIGWRTTGMVLSALLFALSLLQLILRPDGDAAVWRGLALASLYLLLCLSQRRLFAPARMRYNRRLR